MGEGGLYEIVFAHAGVSFVLGGLTIQEVKEFGKDIQEKLQRQIDETCRDALERRV